MHQIQVWPRLKLSSNEVCVPIYFRVHISKVWGLWEEGRLLWEVFPQRFFRKPWIMVYHTGSWTEASMVMISLCTFQRQELECGVTQGEMNTCFFSVWALHTSGTLLWVSLWRSAKENRREKRRSFKKLGTTVFLKVWIDKIDTSSQKFSKKKRKKERKEFYNDVLCSRVRKCTKRWKHCNYNSPYPKA